MHLLGSVTSRTLAWRTFMKPVVIGGLWVLAFLDFFWWLR
jgi:hypothetical protein